MSKSTLVSLRYYNDELNRVVFARQIPYDKIHQLIDLMEDLEVSDDDASADES